MIKPEGGFKWFIHDPGLHAEGHFEEFRCLVHPAYGEPNQAATAYARWLCGDDLDKCRRFLAGVKLDVWADGYLGASVFIKCEPYFYEAFHWAEALPAHPSKPGRARISRNEGSS